MLDYLSYVYSNSTMKGRLVNQISIKLSIFGSIVIPARPIKIRPTIIQPANKYLDIRNSYF